MFLSKTLFHSIQFKLLLLILHPNGLGRFINVSPTPGSAPSLKFLGDITAKGWSGGFLFFFRSLLGMGRGSRFGGEL